MLSVLLNFSHLILFPIMPSNFGVDARHYVLLKKLINKSLN